MRDRTRGGSEERFFLCSRGWIIPKVKAMGRQPSMMQKERARYGSLGLTLFELLVVLVIVAIGASLVLLGIGRGVGGDASRRFALEFSRMVRLAKVRAMAQGVPAAMCLDPAQRRIYISGELEWVPIPENIRIEAEGVVRNVKDHSCVVFYSDGSASGGRFKVSRERVVLARLQVDTITGTVMRYSLEEGRREGI